MSLMNSGSANIQGQTRRQIAEYQLSVTPLSSSSPRIEIEKARKKNSVL